MTDLERTMLDWFDSPDPALREHARRRIAIGFVDFEAAEAALARVAACPERGGVLPHTRQPECGCDELTECHLDKGESPAGVTLRECLACVNRGSK